MLAALRVSRKTVTADGKLLATNRHLTRLHTVSSHRITVQRHYDLVAGRTSYTPALASSQGSLWDARCDELGTTVGSTFWIVPMAALGD